MSYDDVEIEDMEFVVDEEQGGLYTYPCPCGDYFQITLVRSLHSLCLQPSTPVTLSSFLPDPAVILADTPAAQGAFVFSHHCALSAAGVCSSGGAVTGGRSCEMPELFPVHNSHLRPGKLQPCYSILISPTAAKTVPKNHA